MQTARSDLDGIRLISPADGLSCEQAVLFHRLLDQRLCGGSGTECPEACKCMDGITRNSPEGVGFRTLVKGRGFKADMVERAVYEDVEKRPLSRRCSLQNTIFVVKFFLRLLLDLQDLLDRVYYIFNALFCVVHTSREP
jgi:hypothetical protein